MFHILKVPILSLRFILTGSIVNKAGAAAGNALEASGILCPLYTKVRSELGVTYVWKMQKLAPTRE